MKPLTVLGALSVLVVGFIAGLGMNETKRPDAQEGFVQLSGPTNEAQLVMDAQGRTVGVWPDSARPTLSSVFLLLSPANCLSCMAELPHWDQFAQRFPEADVAIVLIGGPPGLPNQLRDQEGVSLPVYSVSSVGGFLEAIVSGVSPPIRVFLVDKTVIIADTNKGRPEAFFRAVAAVLEATKTR